MSDRNKTLARFWRTVLPDRIQTFFQGSDESALPEEEGALLGDLDPLETVLTRSGLPPGRYRRCFMPEPVKSAAGLIGRGEELERLERNFQLWRGGSPCAVALIGPPGCGKTSLLNGFLESLPARTLLLRGDFSSRLASETAVVAFFSRLFDVDAGSSDLNGLVSELLNQEPRVVVLEEGHNLLLRVIGGRRAAEAFLYILLATRQRHFWVTTFRSFPWANLDRHAGAGRYFTDHLALAPLDRDSLRTALMRRQEESGYPCYFQSEKEEEPAGTDHQQSAELGEKREERFFAELFAASEGNPRAALYFWLFGSGYHRKSRTVLLHPPGAVKVDSLGGLDHLQLLTLAEVIGHGVLSASEHGAVFRTAPLESRLIFQYLGQLRLLETTDHSTFDEPVVTVPARAYGRIVTLLKQQNLLY